MTPHSILAVTDFSSQGDHALARAAMLSAEHGAALKIACIAWPGDTPPRDAATRLACHAQQLSKTHGISARAAGRLYHSLDDLSTEVTFSDMVVWGAASMRNLRSFFLGQPAEQLARHAGRPVLVVRRPVKHPYRRVLAAVDLSATSDSLAKACLSISKTASVQLFHSVKTPYEGKLRNAAVSASVVQAYRDHCLRHAQNCMMCLLDRFDTKRNRLQSITAPGDLTRQMVAQQERSDLDLIVVGKRPGSTYSDLFFGSVAGRFMDFTEGQDARADVLIVPHNWQWATSTSAARRLAAEARSAGVTAGASSAAGRPHPVVVRAGA